MSYLGISNYGIDEKLENVTSLSPGISDGVIGGEIGRSPYERHHAKQTIFVCWIYVSRRLRQFFDLVFCCASCGYLHLTSTMGGDMLLLFGNLRNPHVSVLRGYSSSCWICP
mmetsp:Transcript_4153/g.9001  ORF Transcript_4153/g.9001 Transcript_4153/m.9001 type:complete len:112 (+) Transcript_4153:1824-2159(+)